MTSKRICFHLGPYGTYSSAIQSTLASNRAQLKRFGVCYPEEFVRNSAHFGLRDGYKQNNGDLSYLSAVKTVVESAPEDVIVFSNEALSASSSLSLNFESVEPILAELGRLTQGHSVELILYCPRQDEAIERRFVQAVQWEGRFWPLQMDDVLSKSCPVDYFDLVERLNAHFPDCKMVLRPLDLENTNAPEVVRDFMALIGVPSNALLMQTHEEKLSGEYVRLLQVKNNPNMSHLFQPKLVETAQDAFSENGSKPSLFSADTRQDVMTFFDESNKRLIDTYVDDADAKTFRDLFSRSPRSAQPNIALKIEKLVPFLKADLRSENVAH